MAYTLFNLSSGAIDKNISVSAPALSLQDAFSFINLSPKPGFGVFQRACNIAGLQSCTTSCLNASALFGSLETFHNCLVYPAVAGLYINGSLGDMHLADSLGIGNETQAAQAASSITNTIYSCLSDYCDVGHDNRCKKDLQGNSSFQYDNNTLYASGNIYFSIELTEPSISRFDICDYVAPFSFLNADIGGIGVYISYWIQSGLSILGTILILLWSLGTYYLCFPILATRYGKEAKEVARTISAKYKGKRLPSLTAALTDFQKAQCFFMMAINIAALVNRYKGGLDPTNLQQLYNNYVLIRSVSVSGYLPVTLSLLGLHIVAMVSWYLLILSILTVGVSMVTLVDLGRFSPSRSDLNALALVTSENENLKSCGGMNLTVYCLHTINEGGTADWDPSTGAEAALAFCLVVLVFVAAEQGHAFTDPSNKETRTWLLKVYEFCVLDSISLRGFEFILALLCYFMPWPLQYTVGEHLYIYTMAYLGYIFVISHLGHGHTQKALGKLKSDWFLFAADFITAVLWLLLSFASLNILVMFSWILFTGSAIRSMNHLCAHSPKFREWVSACQSRCFGGPSLTPLPPSKDFQARRWINFALVIKTSMVVVALTRRYVKILEAKANIQDWSGKGRQMIVFLIYLTFAGFYVWWFRTFFIDLAWFAHLVDHKSWGFGQIVAITVWAGPLCEYIHLELRGMKRGFQHRLIWPYKVIMDTRHTAKEHKASSSATVPQAAAAPTP